MQTNDSIAGKGKQKNFHKRTSFVFCRLCDRSRHSASLYQTAVYFLPMNHVCSAMCIRMQKESWKQSVHMNNKSGTESELRGMSFTTCGKHLDHYTAKAKLGLKDVWGYLTKDSADFNWDEKSQLENAVKYIPDESCKSCHHNLFLKGSRMKRS